MPLERLRISPTRRDVRRSAIAFAICLFVLSAPARAQLGSKSDLYVQQAAATLPALTPVPIIISVKGSISTLLPTLKLLGFSLDRTLTLINSVSGTLPVGSLALVANLLGVSRISMDVLMTASDEFTVSSSGADVAYSQYSLTGSGVGIAVLDSGVKTRQDLQVQSSTSSRIVASVSMLNGDTGTDDLNGHGTHIAGIAAGNGKLSTDSTCFRTFYGIARSASIINVRVLDKNGQGNVSAAIAGIQWALDNKKRYNIRVMNLSFGHAPGESAATDPLCVACEKAWTGGIVVVCAAGNYGRANTSQSSGQSNEGYGTQYGSITSPANDPFVITVGAMKSIDGNRAHDTIATYSSRGPSQFDFVLKPDIVAAGNKVISLRSPNSITDLQYGSSNTVPLSYYRSTYNSGDSSNYFRLSGTSMASPVVAGAAALMLQSDPSLTPDTVKARLMISADKWLAADGSFDPATFGAGYLNIPAALKCTVVPTTSAISPQVTRNSDGKVYLSNALTGSNALWGTNALWGNNAIWGAGVSNLNAVWGSNALWGTNAVWGSNALWGTNAVWGSNAIWGNNALWGCTVWTNNALWGNSTDSTSTYVYGE